MQAVFVSGAVHVFVLSYARCGVHLRVEEGQCRDKAISTHGLYKIWMEFPDLKSEANVKILLNLRGQQGATPLV